MTNGERIMKDVASIVREYENGNVKTFPAVSKIAELSALNCSHCIYCGTCKPEDHTKTCYNGTRSYIEGEA